MWRLSAPRICNWAGDTLSRHEVSAEQINLYRKNKLLQSIRRCDKRLGMPQCLQGSVLWFSPARPVAHDGGTWIQLGFD